MKSSRCTSIFLLFVACVGAAFAQTPVVGIRAVDALAIEKSTATTVTDTATFEVSRTGSAAGDLVVNLVPTGNAVLTTDYTVTPAGATASVTIPTGKTSVTIVVTPAENTTQQDERTLTLTAAAGAGYTIVADASATVYIEDMDKAGSSTWTGNADLHYAFRTVSGTYAGSAARIYIPTYRGVDVPVVRVAAEGVNPQWMAHWAYDNGVAVYSVSEFNQTLNFLPTLATISGHPEVANAMYIGIGVSSGATAACQTADKNASRAVFAFGITGSTSSYVPSLHTSAEFDDAYQFHNGEGNACRFGAITIAENRGRHTYSYDLAEQKLFFFDRFTKLRADYQPGVAGRDPLLGPMVARPVDFSHGYVGEGRFGTEFFNYATWEAHTIPVQSYNKTSDADRGHLSWLPDAATAAAWRAFTNRGENHCLWDFPQLGYKDDMQTNQTMACMVNTAQSHPCVVDTGLFTDADLCEFYDNEVLVGTADTARTDSEGHRVFDFVYSWDDSRLGVRLLHSVLVNTTTGKRVQVGPPRVVYAVPHKNSHNTAPTITPVSAMTVDVPSSTTTINIPFTIGDVESSVDSLLVKFGTPDESMAVYKTGNFTSSITGTGANRVLNLTMDPTVINKGGVIGGILMVGDGELSANAYVTVKIRKPDSAPYFQSIQSIGSMTFVSNEVGYDDNAPSGDGMSMCVVVNGWSKEWSVTIRDWDTDPRDLTLTAVSNTPATLPNENIVIGGYGPYRTIQVRPTAYGTQDTSLTLYLSDGTHQVTRTYKFRIIENQDTYVQNSDYKNTAPHIGCIPDQTVFSGEQSKRTYFQVADYHTPSEDLGVGNVRLKVRAFSDNEAVVPNSALFIGDPGQHRWITVKAPAGVSGTANISVIVTDEAGLNATSRFQVTVTKTVPELEADHGETFVMADGGSKVFGVTAYGGELTYQWYLGATGDTSQPISGATLPTLATGALTQSSQYWCRITNSLGHTDSAAQVVRIVASAPAIAAQPQSQTANDGDPVRFSITASGEELSYQWYSGNTGNTAAPVSEGTGSSLAVIATSGASYWCRVTNLKGSQDSSAATITTVDWYAYHDLYTTAQISDSNHANVSEGSGNGTAYPLKNFATGNASGPSITFTDNGTRTAQATGANPSAGTSAFTLFHGKVGVGAKSDKMTAPSSCLISFSGLTPGRKYSVAFYVCRNNFTNQSQFTIQNATGYAAASSAGVTLGGANGNTAAVVEAGSTAAANGRVVRWDNITPTASGGTSFHVLVNKSSLPGASTDFVLPQATMLREVASSAPAIVSATPSVEVAPDGQATFAVAADGAGLTYQWYRGSSGDTSAPIAWDSSSGTYTTEPLAEGASYWVRITGAGASVDSATMSAVVSASLLAPTITLQPSDRTCDESESVTFSVLATSATSYQWRKNGAPIPGATGSTCTVAPAALSSAGSYDCVVANPNGAAASAVAKLTVNPGRPPVILTQPDAFHYRLTNEDSRVLASNYSLNHMICYAKGTGPISFQWRRNGVPISHADETLLYDQSTFESKLWYSYDSGIYDCVVSNAFGSVVSESVAAVVKYNTSLHLGAAATYVTSFSPDSYAAKWVDVVPGGSVTFHCVVRGGTGTLLFGEKDSYYSGNFTQLAEVAGTADPNKYYLFSYTVADVGTNPTNLPDYSTLAKSYEIFSPSNSNNYSTATLSFKSASAPASIQDTVYHAPGVFMSLYQSKTIAVGEAVYAIAIPTVGTAPFTYQWYKNGAQIPGGTEAALIINNAQLSDSGGYHVVVTNSEGSCTAPTITWTVSPDLIYMNSHPQSQSVAIGQPVTFSVGTSGAVPDSYQWYKNGIAIAGATAASYSIGSVSPTDEGSYKCKAERTWQEWSTEFQEWVDAADSKTSRPADLVVLAPPVIVNQPQSQTGAAGQTVQLSVSVVGSIDITQPQPATGAEIDFAYQWRKGGVAIGGATASILTIASATEADEDSYDCVITSTVGAGSVTSSAATITVLPPPPAVISQSAGATVNQGEGATISVAATGDSLVFQWYRGAYGDMSAPVSGATGSSLATGPLNESSLYWVHISNAGGLIVSTPITVGVTPPTPPTITAQPVGSVISVGGSASLFVAASGTSPFLYQWKKNGSAITGANSATFTLGNASLTDSGSYSCAVTNTFGSATSSPATIAVSGAPIISSHPANASLAQGQSATLTISASGSGLSYQWYQGTSGVSSSPVAGAISASFTTPALVSTTSYWCRVSNAGGSADSNTATVALPNWEAYHDTVELDDNGGGNATQNSAALSSAPTTSVPVVTTLRNFVTGANMGNCTLTQSRTTAAPSVANNNGGVVAPAAGTDADNLFHGKIVVAQKTYQIASGSTFTFSFAGLNPAKRYAVAFFASRDDSRYTVKTKLTLLGAAGWTDASSAGTIPLAGTNNASIEVDVCAGSAAAGRVIRWNDISISGSTFSVKAEMGSSGSSFVVPQCVALIEYDVPSEVAPPDITTHPVGANIASGGSRTLTVAATGPGLTYQWFQGLTGDESAPVSGATSASLTTPALTATTSYWVKVGNTSGSRLSNTATVAVEASPPTLTPLQTWAQSHALSGDNASAGADPDGDGIVNLMEFALGGNPSAHSQSNLPTIEMPDAATLGLTFRRATGGVKYLVESSTTLAPDSWTSEYAIEKNSDPASIGQDIMVEVPLGGATKKFLRLRVIE